MIDSVDSFQMLDSQRETALASCLEQFQNWGMAPPDVEPLILDFGLRDFDRVGLIEFWIANELTAGYCGKYLFTFANQACPQHSHRIKHETFMPVYGEYEVTFNDRIISLGPGQLLAIEPGHVHGFKSNTNALLLELSMPCDISDNYFVDPRANAWLANSLQK